MKKIIIIGGGVAGLVAGITAQKSGYETEIIEKNKRAGGNLCGWERNGYHIDNCLHWLTGTHPHTALYKLWRECGALEDGIYQAPFFYRSTDGKEEAVFHADTYRAEAEMCRLSPTDEETLHGFFDAVRVSMRRQIGRGSIKDSIKEKSYAVRYGKESLFRFAARFHHPLLAAAFTDLIGGEFSTLALIYAYAAFASGNGALPKGGSMKMADDIADTYRALGGTLTLGVSAEELIPDRDRITAVRLSNGEIRTGDAFLLACDPAVSFARLLPNARMPRRLLKMYRNRERVPIYSSFHAAFAVDAEKLPFRGSTVVPVSPFDADGRTLSRLFFREFSHEPSFAPKGKSLVQSMFFVHEAECKRWLSLSGDASRYEEEKHALATTLMQRFCEAFPSLSSHTTLLDAWTPATYHRYFGAFYGAYLGFAMTEKALPLSASPRLPNYKNVLLATQWLSPPGGLPIAAANGKNAALLLPSIV